MVNVTVSLRADEVNAIKERQQSLKATRHEIIKLAIRRYLFPSESTVPLNGRHAHVGEIGKHPFTVLSPQPEPRIEIT